MNAPLTPQDWEYLSTVLDGHLSPLEERRAKDLLARRPELQVALEELRVTRAVLRAAPRRRAPRNFTLTPALARQARPRAWYTPGWAPAFSFTSALATFLLVLSFVVRWPAPGLPAAAPMAAPAPMAAQAERTVQDKAFSSESATPPPVILWNQGGRGAGPDGSSVAGAGVVGPPVLKENFPAAPETDAPAATAAPKAAPALAPQMAVDAQSNPTGPILGVGPDTERGQMLTATQEVRPVIGLPASTEPVAVEPQTVGWLQAGLGLTALLSGLAAWGLWRRGRMTP